MRALRQPEASAPGAEALAVRCDPHVELQARQLVAGDEREDGVGRSRRPRSVRREGGEQVAATPLELLGGPLVFAPGGVDLRRERRLARGPEGLDGRVRWVAARISRTKRVKRGAMSCTANWSQSTGVSDSVIAAPSSSSSSSGR